MLARAGGTGRRAEKPPGCAKPNTGACQGDGEKRRRLKSKWIATAAEGCTPPTPSAWGRHLGPRLAVPLPGVPSPGWGHVSTTQGQDGSPPLALPRQGGALPSLQPCRQPGSRIR